MHEVDTCYRSCVPSNRCVCVCVWVSTVELTYFLYCLNMPSFSIQNFRPLGVFKIWIYIRFFFHNLLFRIAFTYYNAAVLSNWQDLDASVYFLINNGLPLDDVMCFGQSSHGRKRKELKRSRGKDENFTNFITRQKWTEYFENGNCQPEPLNFKVLSPSPRTVQK